MTHLHDALLDPPSEYNFAASSAQEYRAAFPAA